MKAKKVRGLHVPCAACGTVNVVDAETGDVLGLAGRDAPASTPPVDDPAPKPEGDQGGSGDVDGDRPAGSSGSFLGDW